MAGPLSERCLRVEGVDPTRGTIRKLTPPHTTVVRLGGTLRSPGDIDATAARPKVAKSTPHAKP